MEIDDSGRGCRSTWGRMLLGEETGSDECHMNEVGLSPILVSPENAQKRRRF